MSDTEKKEILGQEKDLGADELNEVAGGDPCVCILGGGGEASSTYGSKTCACVFGGGGEHTDEAAAGLGKKCRCTCVAGGFGDDAFPWEWNKDW